MVEQDLRSLRENILWCAAVNSYAVVNSYMSAIESLSDEFERGERIHNALKCTDVSFSAERLFRDDSLRYDDDDDEDDLDAENEEMVNIIIIDGVKKRDLHVTFSTMETSSEPVSNIEEKKPEVRGRSTSHHIGLTRQSSSIRNLFNRVFRRSKSTTDGPLWVKQEQPGPSVVEEDTKTKPKRKRFFKRTKRNPKGKESNVASVEVQEGRDIPVQEQGKFISRLFSKFKKNGNNKLTKDHDEPMVDKPSRLSPSGVHNSFLNLFRIRITA